MFKVGDKVLYRHYDGKEYKGKIIYNAYDILLEMEEKGFGWEGKNPAVVPQGVKLNKDKTYYWVNEYSLTILKNNKLELE